MQQDILKKLDEIDTKIESKKKSWLDILSAISSILVPLVIAFVGLYFTNQYNQNQLVMQEKNNKAELHLEYTKLLIDNITGGDTTKRDFAIRTILQVDTAFGKEILSGIANSNTSAQAVASKALTDDLVLKLFATDKPTRLAAADEILSKWQTDKTLSDLISTASEAMNRNIAVPDLGNGIYNCVAVINSFPLSLLQKHKAEIINLGSLLPETSQKTLSLFRKLSDRL